MGNKFAEDFLKSFDDSRYPRAFTDRYEAMERLSGGELCETLLVREKAGGRLLVAKCYEKGHPLFDSTEPEALRGLSHPGLPDFEGELREGGMRCILREYIAGKTLWESGRESRFSPETARSVGLGLCGILKYLHSRRPPVIHRDIKPQNVVIREDGSPALIDFGISRLYAAGAQSDTVLCGTRDFAPPEQHGFLQTDCRSDIYSLGILLAWMLTGKAAPLPDPKTPLERVIAKCAAFAPEKRFRDAASVERALLETKPSVRKRRRGMAAAAAFIVLALLVVAGLKRNMAAPVPESGFTEPLIEQAVRLMLNKGPDDPLSSGELASVTELYITCDTPCADIQAFNKLHEEQCRTDFDMRGPIKSLADLPKLPNLRILCLAMEQIQDISPLKFLPELNQVELRFNSVTDITPLAGLKNLAKVGLNANPVRDISPLAACPALKLLDLCGARDYDGSALGLLGDLEFLDISNPTDSYLYLGGRNIGELKLSATSFTDLSFLKDVGGLKKLEVCRAKLSDLSELENHPEITHLRLTDIEATDFSVLLKLPRLETLQIGAAMKEIIDPVAAQGKFTVSYE